MASQSAVQSVSHVPQSVSRYVLVKSVSSPAIVIEDCGTKTLVQFAAGNLRLVDPEDLQTATSAEIQEFEDTVTQREGRK